MAVSCKTTGEFQAEAIVYELKAVGFDDTALSIQLTDSKTITITVDTHTSQEAQRAEEIFRQTEGEEITNDE